MQKKNRPHLAEKPISPKKQASKASKTSNSRIQDLVREQTNIILDIRRAIKTHTFQDSQRILSLLDKAYENRKGLTPIKILFRPEITMAIQLFLLDDLLGTPEFETTLNAISLYHEQLQSLNK